jgi:hypothetical protein
MADDKSKDPNSQEFKLEQDTELRFEVESKNEKVVVEVKSLLYYIIQYVYVL